MRDTNQGKIEPQCANTVTPLGRCLVDGDAAATSGGLRSRQKAFGLSLVVEGTALTLLIVAPLLTSVAQPQLKRVVPPMIVNLVGWRTPSTNQNSTSRPDRSHVSIPVWDFRPHQPSPVETSENSSVSAEAFLPGQTGDGFLNGVQIADLNVGPPKSPSPPPVHQNVPDKRLVKVGGEIQQAQLISRIEPRYPILALQIKQEGTVQLHAIISRDGRITALEVISGPPLFVQAALDAVRQWRYRPTMLGGDPVEVDTTITVIFRLHL
jgi:TonB family protein